MLVVCVGVLVFFVGFMVVGRYASWLGVIALAAVLLLLGFGWEWDPDGLILLIPAAVVGAIGLATGIYRRRRIRRAERALASSL